MLPDLNALAATERARDLRHVAEQHRFVSRAVHGHHEPLRHRVGRTLVSIGIRLTDETAL
jgi:hypothetical protein